MVHECQVPGDEFGKLRQSFVRLLVDHNSYLDLLTIPLQVQDSADRFIERPVRLDDVVMSGRDIRIYRDTHHHVGMANISVLSNKVLIREPPPV